MYGLVEKCIIYEWLNLNKVYYMILSYIILYYNFVVMDVLEKIF